jgi:pimeloyl-ACP methyl ester carboxylesterase
MLRNVAALTLLLFCAPAWAGPRWQELPPIPAPVTGETTGYAVVNGIRLYYATIGSGPPVVMLHGGLSNSDYWGHQVQALIPHHLVILVDSRGHGRSSRNDQPFGYELMTDDVVGLLDVLKIPRADIVGWSDGAILGLDMAMRHPDRVGKVFAFGANSDPSGLIEGLEKNPTFAAFIDRAGKEYEALSPTPKDYAGFVDAVGRMWSGQPRWTDADLKQIRTPVVIADGDHEEGIKRAHTEYLAATIPGAGLLILPNVSHFAFLQDPALFNAALLNFLDGR